MWSIVEEQPTNGTVSYRCGCSIDEDIESISTDECTQRCGQRVVGTGVVNNWVTCRGTCRGTCTHVMYVQVEIFYLHATYV